MAMPWPTPVVPSFSLAKRASKIACSGRPVMGAAARASSCSASFLLPDLSSGRMWFCTISAQFFVLIGGSALFIVAAIRPALLVGTRLMVMQGDQFFLVAAELGGHAAGGIIESRIGIVGRGIALQRDAARGVHMGRSG